MAIPTSVRRGRLAALWAIALGPDSYGIVFVFLVVDYVFLTVGWTGRLAIIVTAVWLGLTVLLAFRTSEVPHRLMVAFETHGHPAFAKGHWRQAAMLKMR